MEIQTIYTLLGFLVSLGMFWLGIVKYMDQKFREQRKDLFDSINEHKAENEEVHRTIWNRQDTFKDYSNSTFVRKDLSDKQMEWIEKNYNDKIISLMNVIQKDINHMESTINSELKHVMISLKELKEHDEIRNGFKNKQSQ